MHKLIICLVSICCLLTPASPLVAKPSPYPRNFHAPLSPQDRRDIEYVVITLAKSNPLTVVPHMVELREIEDRINPVHPLPFLECIFTDEKLKVGIRNLRQNDGMLWHQFMSGLNGSLAEEKARNNLTDEMVLIFAQKIGIEPVAIHEHIRAHQWYAFVETLIARIPREGNYRRYNM